MEQPSLRKLSGSPMKSPREKGDKLSINPKRARTVSSKFGKELSESLVDICDLINCDLTDQEQVITRLGKICRNLTHSSSVEIAFPEENYLRLARSQQEMMRLPMDENSLQGFVANSRSYCVINNPGTSLNYSKFPIKLKAFNPLTGEPAEPLSIACVPIILKNQLYAVITLFNKIDDNRTQSYFKRSDVALIEAVSYAMETAFFRMNELEELQKYNQSLFKLVEEQQKITKAFAEQTEKKHLLDKLQLLLEARDSFTTEAAQLIARLLDSDGVVLHICKPDLRPVVVYSLTGEIDDPKKTATSTAALNLREIVSIADMNNDPAYKGSCFQSYHSCMCIPLIVNGESIGVLELLNKSKHFEDSLQPLAQQIADLIKPEYTRNFFESDDVILSSPLAKLELEEQFLQLSSLLDSLRISATKLIQCETCCIYLVDDTNKTAVTQKSVFSDILEVSLEHDTFLGHVYFSKRLVALPQDNKPHVKDLGMYSGVSVACLPIFSQANTDLIQGLVMLTRANPFTTAELVNLKQLGSTLAFQLDMSSSSTSSMLRLLKSKKEFFPDEPNLSRASRSQSMQINLFNSLTGLIDVSSKRVQDLKPVIKSIQTDQVYPLKQLSQNLRRVIPCQHAKLFLIDESQTNLYDIANESLVKISGLTKSAIQSKHTVVVNGSASRRPTFDRYCDSLGLEQMTETFLCVPVLDFFNTVIGVMTFVNSPVYFSEEDVKIADFISLMPRELTRLDDNQLLNWQTLIKAERRHKSLEHWFKQVTIVSSNANQKATFAKDVLLALNANPDVKVLFKYALLIVRAITNSEDACVIYKSNEVFTEFNKDGRFLTSSVPESIIKEIQHSNQVMILESGSDYQNMLLIPLRCGDRSTGVLKVINKKDESTSLYCNYSKQDEQCLVELASYMAEAVLALSADQKVNLEKLYAKVKEMASSLNTYTLLSVIRTAAQNLLNCDRGTVFIREGEFLLVKAQALEQEVPANFKIPVGSGIVGCVVQTGATEIIADVYQDPRFNNEMDLRTGYRTRSVLCMPVKDSNGYVIAALQMINKRSGIFTQDDAELLELFTEQVGSVLQSTSLFNKTLEESCQFYNILTSLGSSIIVFDQQGRLMFSNKPIESMFGVAERLAKRSHFAVWLRENQVLVQDLARVYDQPSQKIEKQSQKLITKQLLRSGTLSSFEVLKSNKSDFKVFNYAIQSLSDLFSKKSSGAVLILEDVSEFEALRNKFADMEVRIKDLTAPVKIETSLQKCLHQLTKVSKNIESPSEKDIINEVIESLRAGNLYSPQIITNEVEEINADLKALRDYLTADVLNVSNRSSERASHSRRSSEVGMHLELTELRDWNLNVFEIDNFTPLIISMLDDFELFDHFGIDRGIFVNFVNEIHELCEIRSNPFHNFTHCFTVMHSVYMLLVSTPAKSCFNPSEILALLVGALCHDVDHTGRGNAFEINKGSHLALLYHDKSVLEQHHAAVAFFTMQRSDCNILANLEPEIRKRVRQIMIHAILDTDMAAHFRIIPEMKSRFADLPEYPFGTRENDTKAFGGFVVHCADLSHPAKDFVLCSRFSQLVCQEFSAQHREEVELGLPITEFMKDLEKPAVYYKNEINFLNFVVLPLWKCSVGWLGNSVTHCVDNIEANMKLMQIKLQELTGSQ
mmetsp:Transcript_9628/g.18765  ORF Transcript_9628/g.18765 Transcript_9628/m.18765 type:complete len:1649 (-) Transcript_9628:2817-7763(-)